MSLTTVTLAKDAWKLLRGLSCIYKPSDTEYETIFSKFTEKITNDLNSMKQSDVDDRHDGRNQLVPSQSYANHPLVLGPGFEPEDLTVEPININSYRMSGLTLINVNDEASTAKWRTLTETLPSTYRVTFRFGKSTDTLFTDGKTTELSTTRHLVNKPQKV